MIMSGRKKKKKLHIIITLYTHNNRLPKHPPSVCTHIYVYLIFGGGASRTRGLI